MFAHADDWVLVLADAAERAAWLALLAQEGYHTLEAASSAQALTQLRSAAHALVVLIDAPHTPLLNAVIPDRRIARHHAYILVSAPGDSAVARATSLLDQLPLRTLPYPSHAQALLDAVSSACRHLPVHQLYAATASGSLTDIQQTNTNTMRS